MFLNRYNRHSPQTILNERIAYNSKETTMDETNDEDYTFSYREDLNNELDTIKQTMICLAVGCYVNIMLSLCILL